MTKNVIRSFTYAMVAVVIVILLGCSITTTQVTVNPTSTFTSSRTIYTTSTYISEVTLEDYLFEVFGEPGIEIESENSILISTSEGLKDNYYLYTIDPLSTEMICVSCEIGVNPSSNYDKYWSPAWAPDGDSYSFGFVGMPFDGIILRQKAMLDRVLINGKNAWFNNLAWSPDGRYIAYSRNNNVDDRVDVCYIKAAGDAPNEQCAPVVDDNRINTYPTWSSDGINILFTSAGDKYRFYLWNIEDNSITQFTDISGDDLFGKWSPDGTQFAYIVGTRVSESGFVPYQYDLYIADADGTNGQIVPNTNVAYDFDWSPDGKKIVFTQRSPIENDQCEVGCLPFTVLKIKDLETGDVTTLTDGTEWIGDPAWRP